MTRRIDYRTSDYVIVKRGRPRKCQVGANGRRSVEAIASLLVEAMRPAPLPKGRPPGPDKDLLRSMAMLAKFTMPTIKPRAIPLPRGKRARSRELARRRSAKYRRSLGIAPRTPAAWRESPLPRSTWRYRRRVGLPTPTTAELNMVATLGRSYSGVTQAANKTCFTSY
jgi:hypothetical protein